MFKLWVPFVTSLPVKVPDQPPNLVQAVASFPTVHEIIEDPPELIVVGLADIVNVGTELGLITRT